MDVKIGQITDFTKNNINSVTVNGKNISICYYQGNFFALSNICTHEHCFFSENGFLEDESIICGCHGASFDLKSGRVLSPPASQPLQTYQVVIKNNLLYIKL